MILVNGNFEEGTHFSEKVFESGLSIYEVVRIFKGKPIFLKDNLVRLSNSLKKSNIGLDVESLNIPLKLERFIALAKMQEGNLKYVLHFTTCQTDEYVFQIPHAYPTEENYRNGVPVVTYAAERENPEVKYINTELRIQTNRLIRECGVYEVLLVDKDGYITEGSRSNVFFIAGDTLYTSPGEYVLPGTSRKRVFDICNKHGIRVVERRIESKRVDRYEAVFLTGTSPLILPICQIDGKQFDASNPLLQKLMEWYFALLADK